MKLPDGAPQYWTNPAVRMRVIEEAEDIRFAVIVSAPPAPEEPWNGSVDTDALADDISMLAGRELPLRDLVYLIQDALIRQG